MRITNRERRDWTLIIFIIPIGIILMMIAGQIAVRIVPQWSVKAGMKSQLDPQTAPKQQVGLIQPVLPEILTPIGWLDTFLTPNSDPGGQDIVFPPFVVFEPTATPSPTASPEPSPTVTKTPIASASPSPSATTVTTVPSVTKTPKPPVDTDTPVPTTTTVTATATSTATALPPVTSTLDPALIPLTPPPPEIDLGASDGVVGEIPAGSYIVINIGGNPVVVTNSSDTDYDLVYYENDDGSGNIQLDSVILGISQLPDGSIYYEIFNWGDNKPDTNTNVDVNTLPPDPGCVAECDNRTIPTADLHPQPAGGTGILIDVDNAPSAPPAGSYDYLVIISPPTGGDAAQVDAIEVTEVPPTP
jgi:hypothetical protein